MNIFSAAIEGKIDVLDQILSDGEDVNTTDSEGWSLTHHAASAGQSEVIRYLAEKGADLEAETDDSEPEEFVWNSAWYKAGSKPLHIAALHGHAESIKVLVELGANLESEDRQFKHKPLHKAAFKANIEAIKQLVECGADLESKNSFTQTPLHYAAENGKVKAIEALVKLGADLERETETKLRPIHYAAQGEHNEAVQAMIKLHASRDGLAHLLRADPEQVLQMLSDFLGKIDSFETLYAVLVFIGEYEESIFSTRTKNVPLFQYITDLGMLRGRELIVEIVNKLRNYKYQLENTGGVRSLTQLVIDETGEVQKEVIKELKCASKTTTGLAEALKSTESRFSWSRGTFLLKSTTSIGMALVGLATYILDVYTDVDFAITMHKFSIGKEIFKDGSFKNCTKIFDDTLSSALDYCQSPFSQSACFGTQTNKTLGILILRSFRNVDDQGIDCFEDGDRFGLNSPYWDQAVFVTIIHCTLPAVVTVIVWVALLIKQRKFRLWNLPFPFISKFYQTGCQIRLYRNETRNKYEIEWSMKKQMKVNLYQKKRDYLLRKMETNIALVNLSTMIESSLESTFQEQFKINIQCSKSKF